MNLIEMILDYLKSSGKASECEIASAFGITEREANDILSSSEKLFAKSEDGNWQLTPLYSKDYLSASSYIGMEVIHSALVVTASFGRGVVTDAYGDRLTVQFANKSVQFSFPGAFKKSLNPVDTDIRKRLWELGICDFDYSYLKFELRNGAYTVVDCDKNVVEAIIPDNHKGLPVTTIGIDTFHNCKKLEIISLPKSITKIEIYEYTHPFRGCESLREFIVDEQNPKFASQNGVLFSKDKKILINYPTLKTDKFYKIDDTVETIAKHCYFSCNLKGLWLGEGISKIHTSLSAEKIYIPETFEASYHKELFDSWYDDGGISYTTRIVGGKRNSPIEHYCNGINLPFIALEDCEIEEFFNANTDELCDRIEKQYENETEFVVSDGCDYEAKYKNGVLEISALCEDAYLGYIGNTINLYRRKNIKEIIIGEGIAFLMDGAFHGTMNNLEHIHIGKDVQSISEDAFYHYDWYTQQNFHLLQSITVDEENKNFKSKDGILYTYDMKTLIRYPHAKQSLYLEINSDVGRRAFLCTRDDMLACIKFGKGCSYIGEEAFNDCYCYLHAWFDKDVCEFADYPFTVEAKRGTAWRRDDLVIGGYRDSYAYEYFKDAGAYLLPIEDESEIQRFMEIQKFMYHPFQNESDEYLNYEQRWEKHDPYYAQCRKMLLMDSDGTVWQCGEMGEEFALPEGAKIADINGDMTRVKKLHIPKTLEYLITHFDKSGKDLQEITVAEGNKKYKTVDGHLYSMDNKLLTYLPTTHKPGIIPDGTTKISVDAFDLLDKPLEKLYIPSSLETIEMYGKFNHTRCWFYDVEVSSNNKFYSSVDGNITSKDKKTLIYAKVSKDGFTVPDGIEIIGECSLFAVNGVITIPACVKEIKLGYFNGTICTTSGSYAEAYAKENKIRRIVDGVLIEP